MEMNELKTDTNFYLRKIILFKIFKICLCHNFAEAAYSNDCVRYIKGKTQRCCAAFLILITVILLYSDGANTAYCAQ